MAISESCVCYAMKEWLVREGRLFRANWSLVLIWVSPAPLPLPPASNCKLLLPLERSGVGPFEFGLEKLISFLIGDWTTSDSAPAYIDYMVNCYNPGLCVILMLLTK